MPRFEIISKFHLRIPKAPGEPAMNLNSANGLSTHSKSRSLGCARRIAAAAGALFVFTTLAPAFAQTPTLILMRAMPAKTKSGETFTEMAPITKSDITSVKIGGKDAEVTDVQPLLKRSEEHTSELQSLR